MNFLSKKGIFYKSIFLLLIIASSSIVEAAVPEFINYQSRLRDASDEAITSAITIQFSIYDNDTLGAPEDIASSGGNLLWTERYSQSAGVCKKITPDNDGYFSVQLGICESFPSYLDFSADELYLGVKIEADTEAAPRVQLGTAPYAFNSKLLNGIDASSFLRSDEVDIISALSASTLLTLDQEGSGDILNLLDDGVQVFTIQDGGNVGIGDSSPLALFTVGDGDMFQVNSSGEVTASSITSTGSISVIGTSPFVLEGVTEDDFETTITVTDPTADRNIILPDTDGTIALTSDITTTLSGLTDTNISGLSSGDILIYDGIDSYDNMTLSGYATMNASGVLSITNDIIDFTEIADFLTLDTTTRITTGANDFEVDLNGGGSFNIKDDTTTLFSVNEAGSVSGSSFIKSGGTSTQFLKADGSVDTNTYLTADVSIADGGTGQSTAQTAINALTSVAGATNEYVLTKDTGTGNAIWKVASGGGGGASTLAEVSTGSDDTAKSLYTMTSAVDVEFESSDNNTILYLDEANERVGIGTTSPAYKLDIAGKIAISGEQTIYNAEGEDGFTGSLFIGDGGGSLLHTTGAEGYYNTGVGIGALIANTTGSHNTANGYYSLNSNTTGLYNTALGTSSLYSNTTGEENTASGYSSLYSNTTGDNNIAIGRSSLYFNTTGSFNTASGMYSLYSNDSGSYNTANGYYSLGSNRTGRYNTASGRYSLRLNTTGFFNTASGNYSLGSNTTGDNNIAIGYQSGRYITDGVTGNTTGDSNIFIGRDTKAFANNDQNEIVIGYNATGAGSNSVVLGNDSIVTTLLKGNVGIGTTPAYKLDVAGKIAISGEQTIYNAEGEDGFTGSLFIGDGGGSLLHTTGAQGYYNTGVGIGALSANTTGAYNTANGYYSLSSNTTGSYNTANGWSSLRFNTTGANNTANGMSSLYSSTTGSNNTAFGRSSLHFNTTGANNLAFGMYSLYSNTTGSFNTANGRSSLHFNTTGSSNLALGTSSLYSNTTGSSNLAFGYQSGRYITDGVTANTSGDFNIFIGRDAKALADNDQNEIVIGYNATGAGSNSVVLGNDSIVTTLLKGDVGIGTITPAQKLDVAGNAKFSAVGSGAYAFDLNLTSDGTLTTSSSDERLKENVLTLDSDDILEKINQLNPSSFEWKSNNSPDIGLIAQEVESVFPGLVFTNPTDGYKGINYSRLSTLAISAIQEVDKRLEVIRGYITETGEGLVAIFKELTVGKLNIDGDVCVDDVCITKEQFKNLLLSTEPEQVNQTQTNTSSESTTTSGTTDSETANEAVTEFSDDNISEDTGISESENLVPVEDSEADVVEIILNEEEVVETTDTQEVIDDTIMDSEPIVEDTETPAPQEELNNV